MDPKKFPPKKIIEPEAIIEVTDEDIRKKQELLQTYKDKVAQLEPEVQTNLQAKISAKDKWQSVFDEKKLL